MSYFFQKSSTIWQSFVLRGQNWHFLWIQPYKKQKHGEQLIYLDRRMVTKITPAECSEGYLRACLRKNRPVILDQKKLISLIFWDIKAFTLVVTKIHFVWPKVINIFFYEFLNFQTISGGVIAFQTAKIANIDRALENEHLAQKAWFSFPYTDTPL